MKLYGGKLQGNNFYDRNPKGILFASLQQAIAPHGNTQRGATYTVPAARRFVLTSVNFLVERITVATTPLHYGIQMQIAIVGGGSSGVANCFIEIANAIGSSRQTVYTPEMFLAAGDTIQIFDQDGSTGGTVSFLADYTGVEFDA